MSQKNDFDDPIDPRLEELLHKLQATPAREAQSAARGRTRYLAQLDALGLSRPKSRLQDFLGWLTLNNFTNQRSIKKDGYSMATRIQKIAVISAVVVMAVMVLLFSGGAMTAYASRAALPGDALYTVKTGIERTEVTFSKSSAVQAELHLQFAQRRLDEMATLINEGRFNNVSMTSAQFEYHVQQAVTLFQTIAAGNPAQASALASQVSTTLTRYTQSLNSMLTNVPETTRSTMTRAIQVSNSGSSIKMSDSGEVEFSGTVEEITPTSWTVSGSVLAITPETEIKGAIVLGDMVQVDAFTASDGTLTAREIQLEDEGNANTNDNQNGNDNGNINENDNGNENVNDNGNENDNENENENVNDNGNENDNENENENVNANGNENDNDNGNANDQHHDKVEFSGAVEVISSESWTIAGRTVAITPSTEIEGSIVAGSQVEVKAMTNADGSLTALKIKLSEDNEDNSNENSNGNINSNTNTNSNENENHNGNENGNENDDEENHNSNVNHNGNSNHNGNGNDNGNGDDGGGGGDD